MKRFPSSLVLITAVLLLSQNAGATEFSFARLATGTEILLGDNEFYDRLGKADINLRTRSTSSDASLEDLKSQYAGAVREWNLEEIGELSSTLVAARRLLAPYEPLLPDTIYLVKVTSDVEGGLPHTRGNAIFLAPEAVKADKNLLLHEIFHILSRHHVERQAELYSLLGFKSCELTVPLALKDIRLTNPDAPYGAYYVPLKEEGTSNGIVPVIFSSSVYFDPKNKSGFAGHLEFALMKVRIDEGECEIIRGVQNGVLRTPSEFPEYFAALGQNTGYVIHPEEVLADNFVALLNEQEDLPNPEIPERLKAWLEGL